MLSTCSHLVTGEPGCGLGIVATKPIDNPQTFIVPKPTNQKSVCRGW